MTRVIGGKVAPVSVSSWTTALLDRYRDLYKYTIWTVIEPRQNDEEDFIFPLVTRRFSTNNSDASSRNDTANRHRLGYASTFSARAFSFSPDESKYLETRLHFIILRSRVDGGRLKSNWNPAKPTGKHFFRRCWPWAHQTFVCRAYGLGLVRSTKTNRNNTKLNATLSFHYF